MNEVHTGGADGQATRPNASALRVANGLAFAASPTFAIMALLTGLLGGSHAEMLCSGASPLTGMVAMYVLMATFHMTPWLKLVRKR